MNDATKLILSLAASMLVPLLVPMGNDEQPQKPAAHSVAVASDLPNATVPPVTDSQRHENSGSIPIMFAQLEYPEVEIHPDAEPITEPVADPVPDAPPAATHDATTLKLLEIAEQIKADADRLRKLSEATDAKIADGQFGTFKMPPATIAAPACQCNCPTADEFRQIIRQELLAMSRGTGATAEDIDKVAATFDPVSGEMANGPTIVMLSLDGCPPCDAWWNNERPQYEAQGWTVIKGDATLRGVPSAPTFCVFDGKRWHRHDGPMTGNHVRAMLGMRSANGQASTQATQEPIQVIYRDTLPASNYGAYQQTTVQSYGSNGGGQSYQAPAVVPQFASGNCATGACGTSAAPRGGLFGGFFRR